MTRSTAATEFRALNITQRRLAQLFSVNPRTVRHWRYGDRRLPHAVSIVCILLTTGAVTIEQVEQAAGSAPANGNAKPKPSAPLEPPPDQSASARAAVAAFADLSPAAAAVVALTPGACRWPLGGDPQDRAFRFCNTPATEPPYCARHRSLAYLAPRIGSGHGVRVAHGRYSRPSIPGAFSATGTSRPPISRAAPGKATQVPASPSTGTRSIQHRAAQPPPPT